MTARQGYTPPWEMTSYTFAFLVQGDKSADYTEEQLREIQRGHLKNIEKMADTGKLVAAGPFGDNTDLRGVLIFSDCSIEEAEKMAAEDPAIKAGRLKFVPYRWYGPAGIGVTYREKKEQDPDYMPRMVNYTFGILKSSGQKNSSDPEEDNKIQMAHLNHINEMAASGKLLAAGPFTRYSDESWRGILIFDCPGNEAEQLAGQDPAVLSGRLVLELHPLWMAEDVMP